jgi:hypothetical protein
MKAQLGRWLLVIGFLAGVSSTAWAGPTTSTMPGGTTTTTTTMVGGTTTTTTAGPTTTTTAAPTTTTTTSTTTSTVPTTTTTTIPPAPGDLSGDRAFYDKKGRERNTTRMVTDTSGNSFCLAGQVTGTDPTDIASREVILLYQSVGTIKKANDKKVDGEFASVDLTLQIIEQTDPPATEYMNTITSFCDVKGSLKKEGDASKARLRCDVGPNFSQFPDLTDSQVENIRDAFLPKKGVNVNVKKGRVRVKHSGEPAPEGAEDAPPSCPVSGG